MPNSIIKRSFLLTIICFGLFLPVMTRENSNEKVEYRYKGKVISYLEFWNNNETGTEIRYHENGKKKEECHWVNGRLHSHWKSWYANGKLESDYEYNQGINKSILKPGKFFNYNKKKAKLLNTGEDYWQQSIQRKL